MTHHGRYVKDIIKSGKILQLDHFLLALWKDLPKLNLIKFWIYEKNYFCYMILPDSMVRSKKLWHHQNEYVHVIIYVCFYIYPWYWKFAWTHERCQEPRPRGIIKYMAKSEGGGFWLIFLKISLILNIVHDGELTLPFFA